MRGYELTLSKRSKSIKRKNINPVVTQKVALDNALVAPEKRLNIERCNARIEFSKPQNKATYQNTIKKIRDTDAYSFKIDKKKCRVDTEVFREILQIFTRLHNQDFIVPPSKDELIPFIQELGYSRNASLGKQEDLIGSGNHELKSCGVDIKASKAYKTYHEFATGKVSPKKARKFKKVTSPSKKLSPVLEEEPVKKPKKAKKTFQEVYYYANTLLEVAQVLDESQDKTTGTDEGTDTKSGVPYVSKDHLESENESWGDSEEDDSNDDVSDDVSKGEDAENDGDGDNDASDNESTDSDEEENHNLTLKDNEEEETQDDEYIHTSNSYASTDEETNDDYREFDEEEYDKLYKDVNVTPNVAELIDDAHVTLTTTQKTEGSMQSSFVLSDFASKFLNLDNVPLADNEVTSMMNVKVIMKKSNHSGAPLFSYTRIGFSTQTALQSYTAEFEKKARAKKEKYINIIKKSMKEIIKDEVKSQLPQILPKEISDFATPVIQSTINESLKNVVLAKSSSQPQSTYEAATSLTEFELKKILLDKLEKSKSYRAAEQHRDLYDALVKSYQLNKDLFDSYGKAYSLKRGREDKDKNEDPPAGSYQGLKKRKTSKDAEPPKGSKSKESKSSLSKGTKSQPKTSGKFVQAEEPVFETTDTEMPQDQGDDLGNTEDQPNVEEASKHDWLKKLERPPTPDPDWNVGKQIDFRPPQTWISQIAKAEKPPLTFDELMSTLIDFSAYVMHNLKIDNLTQQHLVGPAFTLLKGTCKSQVKLDYHLDKCYKAVNDRLDWHNSEGHKYPFDLNKPLPLVEDRGRQVVPANYFFNNNLEYLKGVSSSRNYTTSTTKTKVAKYDNIERIEDRVPTLWITMKVAYDKHAIWGTSHWDLKRQQFYAYACHWKSTHDVYSKKRIIAVNRDTVMKWYNYGYLEEIEVRREDHKLYKFKEGDFPRLNLRDIDDMLLLLVQKKLSNLERDDISDISKRTPYTAYNNPQGVIYLDKFKRNRLMRSYELYKFCGGTISFVHTVLHDIASNLRMDYLPKRKWSNLDRQRSCIMIKAIDKLRFERRLMRNLEKFVGGRYYETDLRLLERII
ncbi:hypothetical protein Tco_1192527 [Tanacetum coccineum]